MANKDDVLRLPLGSGWPRRQKRNWLKSPEKGVFFQAEEGIRDVGVTGVQTCALPISIRGEGFLGQFEGHQLADETGVVMEDKLVSLELPEEPLDTNRPKQSGDAGKLERRNAAEIGRASCRERG